MLTNSVQCIENSTWRIKQTITKLSVERMSTAPGDVSSFKNLLKIMPVVKHNCSDETQRV